jgi:hypothetical protein
MGKTRKTIKPPLAARLSFLVLVAATLGATPESTSIADSEELTISASFEAAQAIAPHDRIELRLSRQLAASDGHVAVFVARTDISSLMTVTDNTLVYAPKVIPLPKGESQVFVYLVSSDNVWKEIAQFPLRVQESTSPQAPQNQAAATTQQVAGPSQSTPADGANSKPGNDKTAITPSLTIGMKSQSAETHFPDSSRPPRPTFADLTLQASVQSDVARGGFSSQTQFNVVGSSFQQEALRFATERNEAPNIDLASYLMRFQIGKAKVEVGHIAFGTNRQLINSFSSRGMSLTTPLSKYVDVSLAAMNGTSIVGWSNFFGLSKSKHEFVTGSAGFEFVPEHRGELRFELSLLDGQLLPLSNFNQGNITDAERSRGVGIRMVGADANQRWRFDGGFTRSRFTNPEDPLLSQGFKIVPVQEDTRNASYFDGAFNVLQNARLSDSRKATLTVNYKYEQVDPLFKSIAASVQPDRLQNEIDVVGNIGDVTLTVAHVRFHDNLSNVPSVLKSLSRRSGVILGTPLGALLGDPAKPSPWLPRVSYTLDQVHQFGASIPINGGFEAEASTIPNQVSTNQTISADWQVKTVRWGYRFNRSLQDNRQVGRELADLRNITNVWSLGLQPSAKLGINLDAGWDSALNKEQKRTDHTFRLGPNVNWTITKSMAFTGAVSATSLGDVAGTSRNRTTEANVQWSYRFAVDKGRNKKVQGQFFIRYADRYVFASDSLFRLRTLTKLRTLNTGITFTFF